MFELSFKGCVDILKLIIGERPPTVHTMAGGLKSHKEREAECPAWEANI